MCDGCTQIFIKFKKVIRGAALTHANSFVAADDLIGIINLKFFAWKKNQKGQINLKNAFFYTIAKNAAIDQIEDEDKRLYNEHEDLLNTVYFSEKLNDVETKYLVEQILMSVENHERDALISVINNETVKEFCERNKIEKQNTGIKKRRRAIEAAANRINLLNKEERIKNDI